METKMKAKIFTGKNKFNATYDKKSDLIIVETTQIPEKGKANKEIVKELKKKFKAEAIIVSGLKSREKIIKISLSKEQALQILNNTN
ncbi:MAG: DUF167 domain-containing protein [Candidatus Diapherotrites archaeon]|nr:DUF167 domain-containing protein [Candidatus Diapherotrites archaeon]